MKVSGVLRSRRVLTFREIRGLKEEVVSVEGTMRNFESTTNCTRYNLNQNIALFMVLSFSFACVSEFLQMFKSTKIAKIPIMCRDGAVRHSKQRQRV